MSFFRDRTAEAVAAAANKFKDHEVIEADRNDGITYHANGDVTHFTNQKVVHSRLTDISVADLASLRQATETFALTHRPPPMAIPAHDRAIEMMADMRVLKTPARIK